MKKRLKMFGVMLLTGSIVLGSSQYALAGTQTKQKYQKNADGYIVYTMTVSTGPSNQYKKLNCYGFEKNDYTSGSITVTKSSTKTFSTSEAISSKVEADMKIFKKSFSYAYTVGTSEAVSVSAGVTLNISSKAPKGIYYGYVGVQRRRFAIKKETCTLNHTGWYTWYDKKIAYAPVKNSTYLTAKRLEDIKK